MPAKPIWVIAVLCTVTCLSCTAYPQAQISAAMTRHFSMTTSPLLGQLAARQSQSQSVIKDLHNCTVVCHGGVVVNRVWALAVYVHDTLAAGNASKQLLLQMLLPWPHSCSGLYVADPEQRQVLSEGTNCLQHTLHICIGNHMWQCH